MQIAVPIAAPAPDPYAAARARLLPRIERDSTARPDLPTIEELVAEVGRLQPLPAAAQRILRLDAAGRFSAHDLATVIASDQALTALLLRLANSPFYGIERRIGTVRDAVVLLGFRSVRQVALASCFISTSRPTTHIRYGAFWQFTVATGLLAETLARVSGRHQGEALTADVLHNIGLLALDQHRPDTLGEIIEHARSTSTTRHEAERALLGFTEAELGAALAMHWNFPPALTEAIERHASLDALHEPGSLAAFVTRARLVARSYGLADGIASDGVADEIDTGLARDDTLMSAIERGGGVDRLLERVDAFLGATLR